LTLDETKALVAKFRSRPYIPGFWRELEEAMAASAPDDFHMTLPSGRVMRYRDVKNYGSISAVIPRLGKMMRLKFWGGTLTENIVQASSRDVFMDRCIVLEDNNLPPLLRVHDEAVCLLKEDTAEDDLKLMTEIMSTNPDWWPELPLRAEGHLCKRYTKE
jgi:DNA polymerase bacteriophage-type